MSLEAGDEEYDFRTTSYVTLCSPLTDVPSECISSLWKLNTEASLARGQSQKLHFVEVPVVLSQIKAKAKLDACSSGPFGCFPREDIVRSFTDL